MTIVSNTGTNQVQRYFYTCMLQDNHCLRGMGVAEASELHKAKQLLAESQEKVLNATIELKVCEISLVQVIHIDHKTTTNLEGAHSLNSII